MGQFIKYNGQFIEIPAIETETAAYIARMTVAPTMGLRTLLNTTIKALKDDALWDYIDVLRFHNLHTEQASLLNAKTSAFGDGTNMNELPWEAKKGWQGNQYTDNRYIDSGFDPSTLQPTINYTQDDAFFGGWCTDETLDFGITYSTQWINYLSLYTSLNPRSGTGTSSRTRAFTHGSTTTNQNVSWPTVNSLYIATRTSSTAWKWYKNGVVGDSDSMTSVPIPAGNFLEYGNTTWGFPGHIAQTVYGGGFDDTKHLALYNILKYFNESITQAI